MRKKLVGVTTSEIKPLLSELAAVVLEDSEFEIWKDQDGLYSVSIGINIRGWVLFNATLEKLDHFLVCQIPFYDVEEVGI